MVKVVPDSLCVEGNAGFTDADAGLDAANSRSKANVEAIGMLKVICVVCSKPPCPLGPAIDNVACKR